MNDLITNVLDLEKIIEAENLKAFQLLVRKMTKNGNLSRVVEKNLHRNILNATLKSIANGNNSELTRAAIELSLNYLSDKEKCELIQTSVLNDKMQHYNFLKEKIGDKFYSIQTLESLVPYWKEGEPEFKVWIKNISITSQKQLQDTMRTYIIIDKMPLSHVSYYASYLESHEVLYEALAYSTRGTASHRVQHLFGLLIPDLDEKLLLEKLKKSLNIAESKHDSLKTDNLLQWCNEYEKISTGSISSLKKLLDSYYLNQSLEKSLRKSDKLNKKKL